MYCISMSYKHVPITIREKFAFFDKEIKQFMELMKKEQVVEGCVVLTTCNRSEIYFVGDQQCIIEVEKAWAKFKQQDISKVRKYYKSYDCQKAIEHLFYVTCGLDSMVLGEDEILGQVKKAYQLALDCKVTVAKLNLIFQQALCCAKKVKNTTLVSKTPISIATLVAHEIFHFNNIDNSNKVVFIIGLTGKMGSTIMKNIRHHKGVTIIGTTRQHGISLRIEEEGIQVVDYKERYKYIDIADFIISATTSPHYTLTYDEVIKHIVHHKPRMFMDLSVPKDIDEGIKQVPLAQLNDIDYFNVLATSNNQIKLKEVEKSQLIISEEIESTLKKLIYHEYKEELIQFKKHMNEIPFEQLIYTLREEVSSTAFQSILEVIKQLNQKGR